MDDKKVNYREVVIENCRFKLPTSSTPTKIITRMDSNITCRRQSIRLQDKGVTNMREITPRKLKKRPSKDKVTCNVQSTVEPGVVAGDASQNNSPNNSNQMNLTDNEILEMLGDFATFMESSWDPSSDIFTLDEASGTPASQSPEIQSPQMPQIQSPQIQSPQIQSPQIQSPQVQSSQTQSDEKLQPTASPVPNVASEFDYGTSMSQSISSQTQTLAEHKRSIYTETEPPVFYSTNCQTDSVPRRSVSVQTDFDQRSQSTQTRRPNRNSVSVQATVGDYTSTSTGTDADPDLNGLKRKGFSSDDDESNKCQIFVKNFDVTYNSVNHGPFGYKIPKLSPNRDVDSETSKSVGAVARGVFDSDTPTHSTVHDMRIATPQSMHPKLPRDSSTTDAPASLLHNYQKKKLQRLGPQRMAEMKTEVISVLQGPCLKFLKRENCGPYCKYNHFLPSANNVAEAIRNWSNEQVQFLYLTYVQRYKMCHQMYYDVICTAFAQRRSPENLIATVKDCGRLSMESQFIVVLFALKKCGYTDDDALFEICTNVSRSRNAINEIFKVIVTFKLTNFKRSIAFLSTEMENIGFDPYFGNEILKQAVEIETLDVILLNFCYAIVRKYSCILDIHYMKSLLSKM